MSFFSGQTMGEKKEKERGGREIDRERENVVLLTKKYSMINCTRY